MSLAAAPSWPDVGPGTRIIFLLDASSRTELKLLEEWIDANRPDEGDASDGGGVERFRIPPSRRGAKRRRAGDSPLNPAFEAALAGGDDPLLAPLRVCWLPRERDGVRSARLGDLLKFGDPRDPGVLRQGYVLRSHPDRCRIVAGEPARLSELRRRFSGAVGSEGGATTSLPEYVALQAALALERAERRLRGARYKVPRLVEEEILGSPAFRGALARIARETSRDELAVNAEAAACLREIAATHSPFVIDIAAHLIRLLYTQGYGEQLEYDREKLVEIAALSQRHPVVFLPSHKSNLDHLVLQYALHENGLPPNHTAGGINMNFFPVGPLVRRSGTFFIRRSFREDVVYKHVLRSYIDYLIGKRFSLEWYIEGGRSRVGKLLPPRFGMLAYVVDAYRRGKSDDVHLIPVSIAYDQIQEIDTYADEQRGAKKEKEGFGWFLGVIRSLRGPYGKIYIRFGDPLSLRRALGPPTPERGSTPDERELALQKLAFEVAVQINRATPITPTSLVVLALLGTGDRALTLAETRRSMANLLRYVAERKLPVTPQIQNLERDEGILRTLDALIANDVVTRFTGGQEPVYLIGPEEQLAAAYYRNTIIHFFVNAAIAELAVLHAGEDDWDDPVEEFWAEAMRLRDLLKFEFFFADKERFRQELREEIAFHDAEWEARLREGKRSAGRLIRSFRPFTAHRVLRPFVEAYRVVSDSLQALPSDVPFEEEPFLKACLGLGEQYLLQRRVYSAASVSKALFQTALKLADNRGLLATAEGEADSGAMAAGRNALATAINDVVRRTEAIVALAASRRAGLIP